MSGQTRKLPDQLVKHYLLAISLVLLSYLLFNSLDAYHINGEQFLMNPDFSDDLAGWKVGGKTGLLQVSDGIVEINHQSKPQSTRLYQCWMRSDFPDYLLMAIDASSDGLLVGPKKWHGARVGVTGYLADGGKNYKLSSRLFSSKGNLPWEHYQEGVEISAEFERVCFSISFFKSMGEFQFKNPSLYPAIENPTFFILKNLLMLVWCLFSVWWLILLVQHYRSRPQWSYLMAIFMVIGVGVLAPIELKSALEKGLFYYVPELHTRDMLAAIGLSFDISPKYFPVVLDVSKFGHFVGFFLLSGILFSERAKPVRFLLPGLFLAALGTELLQYFVPGRSPRLSDVTVDSIGIFAGWFFVRFFFWRRQSALA
ncbi:MAG: VanZ family protein [Candidatus Thiodiazotropha sp. 6PDIVS]